MDLATYVKTPGARSMYALHKIAGVSYTTVWKIVNEGHRLDSYSSARRLSDATGGAVSIAELCERPEPPSKHRKRSARTSD